MADRKQIHKRIRAKIKGTTKRPRLAVFRSNQHIYAQLIDDEIGITLCSFSDLDLKKSKGGSKSDVAMLVGLEIAKKAKDKRVEFAVFDRGGFKYHGRVKALAEGARGAGLKF